jgi:hypothetical protein
MDLPLIVQAPTDSEVRRIVDELITPENADKEAKLLCWLLFSTASADDPVQYEIAQTAARHAFMKTTAYEQLFEPAFREFLGFPAPPCVPEQSTIEATGQPS